MLSGAVGSAVLIAIGVAAVPVLKEVDGLAGWVPGAVIAAIAVVSVLSTVVFPILRFRKWRWAIRPDELDYVHGAFVRTRTIVPMSRVQHVATQRGMVDSIAGAATLAIHTAAGTHRIPALRQSEAAALRTQIARQARTPEDG